MDTAAQPHAPVATGPASGAKSPGNQGLLLIGVFEVFKAGLFIIGALIVLHMVKRDTQIELLKLLHAFRVSGDRAFIKNLLLRANVISDPTKRIVGGVLLLYAMLHATEGTGLLLRKRWAEYFTVIMTALPLVFELYWLIHHTTSSAVAAHTPAGQQMPALLSQHVIVLKIIVLISNVAIVWYLIYHLRRSGGHGNAPATLPDAPHQPVVP